MCKVVYGWSNFNCDLLGLRTLQISLFPSSSIQIKAGNLPAEARSKQIVVLSLVLSSLFTQPSSSLPFPPINMEPLSHQEVVRFR